MRLYDIVSGTLFILSIVDFALAAPVQSAQEKRQASVVDHVVHRLPKDVITVWGKRGKVPELLDSLHWQLDEMWNSEWDKYFNSLGDELDASGSEESASHTPSGSGPSQPNQGHGSTNAVQRPPAPPPLPPPGRLPPPLSTAANANELDDEPWGYEGHYGQLDTPTSSAYASSGYASDEEFAQAHAPSPNHNPTTGSDSGTDLGPGPDYNLDYWMHSEDHVDHGPPLVVGGLPRPTSPNELGQPGP